MFTYLAMTSGVGNKEYATVVSFSWANCAAHCLHHHHNMELHLRTVEGVCVGGGGGKGGEARGGGQGGGRRGCKCQVTVLCSNATRSAVVPHPVQVHLKAHVYVDSVSAMPIIPAQVATVCCTADPARKPVR